MNKKKPDMLEFAKEEQQKSVALQEEIIEKISRKPVYVCTMDTTDEEGELITGRTLKTWDASLDKFSNHEDRNKTILRATKWAQAKARQEGLVFYNEIEQ